MPEETIPRFLYHGTSGTVARLSLTEGLVPRGKKKSNWHMASGKDRVYLTDAYAPYFAAQASSDKDEPWGIIKVSTSLLDIQSLVPDEDWLEQAGRGRDGVPGSMAQRTRSYRGKAAHFAHRWTDSLRGLGTCAHLGPIPASAISAVSLFRFKSNPYVGTMACDPSITLLNYAFMGQKYRNLTRWFFEPVPAEDMCWPVPREFVSEDQLAVLRDRSGIEVIITRQ